MPGRVEQDPHRQDAVRQVNPNGPRGPEDPMTESFQQLFEQSLASQQIKPGQILTGTIVDMNDDVVIVSVGLKSEAVIPAEQFRNESGQVDVTIGQEVEVALDAVEDGSGETRLSREKAKRARTWTRLEEAFTKGEIVKGVINGRVKGGFTVELDNVRAFLPGSLVDVRPVRDPSYLEGKELEFKVIKLDQRRNNVVVSRRAVVEQEYSAERSQLLDNLKEGDVVKGTVKNLTDYGAFVDLGGIDGLLHITDMAWKRVKHPSEIVKVGDEIDVRILKFDRERQRVSLGIKQLGADPWQNIARRYPPNTRLFGKVTNIADYGCFVEIEEGVEGLVHVSEMDWTNKNVNPAKVVHVGEEVEVMVLDIDEERRRISLGLKQCKANPWREFADSFNRGDKVSAARSSRSPISASSSGSRAASTASCTSPTSPGTARARRRCATTRRARPSRPWCCRSTRSASASRSASSRWPRTRWRRTRPITRRAASSRAPSRKSTRAARSSTSATASRAACAPPSSRASASRTRARCSRSATRSRRASSASTARAARSRCRSARSRPRKRPRRCSSTAAPIRRPARRSATC